MCAENEAKKQLKNGGAGLGIPLTKDDFGWRLHRQWIACQKTVQECYSRSTRKCRHQRPLEPRPHFATDC